MEAENILHLLTLNPSDFRRFANLSVVTPQQVLQRGAAPP
jgi:hypothetical protein